MEITDGTRTLGVASEEVEECHLEAADKEEGQNLSFYQIFLNHYSFFVQNLNVDSMKSLKKFTYKEQKNVFFKFSFQTEHGPRRPI